MITISKLFSYPIKSTTGISHQLISVGPLGLRHDREWAIFDMDGHCLTGRDYPKLLDVKADIQESSMNIIVKGGSSISIPLIPSSHSHPLKIFTYNANGFTVNQEVNDWFSSYLDVPCQLLKSNKQIQRPVLSKHGGNEDTDSVAFADQAPVLILSEASLADLNVRLDHPIGMERFRPNIVVSGCNAHDEDAWKDISINNIKYKVIQQCERCVFTTIDAISKEKDPNSEPLRTLAKYRKGPKGGVIFGVHAVPLNSGTLTIGSEVKML